MRSPPLLPGGLSWQLAHVLKLAGIVTDTAAIASGAQAHAAMAASAAIP